MPSSLVHFFITFSVIGFGQLFLKTDKKYDQETNGHRQFEVISINQAICRQGMLEHNISPTADVACMHAATSTLHTSGMSKTTLLHVQRNNWQDTCNQNYIALETASNWAVIAVHTYYFSAGEQIQRPAAVAMPWHTMLHVPTLPCNIHRQSSNSLRKGPPTPFRMPGPRILPCCS